jgi:FHA domain-containing protein
MQPANILSVLIAIALAATCLVASGPIAAAAESRHSPNQPALLQPSGLLPQSLADLRDRLAAAAAPVGAVLAAAAARAPLLVAVLSAVLILPVAAPVSLVVQTMARRKRRRTAARAAELRAALADSLGEAPANGPVQPWPHQAWLSLEDGQDDALPIDGQVVRIGRHQDNDIRLPDASVHRYHAVIEHTPDAAFVITDLSGEDGNGLRINGERLARAQLADGDMIELGQTRLRFGSVAARAAARFVNTPAN